MSDREAAGPGRVAHTWAAGQSPGSSLHSAPWPLMGKEISALHASLCGCKKGCQCEVRFLFFILPEKKHQNKENTPIFSVLICVLGNGLSLTDGPSENNTKTFVQVILLIPSISYHSIGDAEH